MDELTAIDLIQLMASSLLMALGAVQVVSVIVGFIMDRFDG